MSDLDNVQTVFADDLAPCILPFAVPMRRDFLGKPIDESAPKPTIYNVGFTPEQIAELEAVPANHAAWVARMRAEEADGKHPLSVSTPGAATVSNQPLIAPSGPRSPLGRPIVRSFKAYRLDHMWRNAERAVYPFPPYESDANGWLYRMRCMMHGWLKKQGMENDQSRTRLVADALAACTARGKLGDERRCWTIFRMTYRTYQRGKAEMSKDQVIDRMNELHAAAVAARPETEFDTFDQPPALPWGDDNKLRGIFFARYEKEVWSPRACPKDQAEKIRKAVLVREYGTDTLKGFNHDVEELLKKLTAAVESEYPLAMAYFDEQAKTDERKDPPSSPENGQSAKTGIREPVSDNKPIAPEIPRSEPGEGGGAGLSARSSRTAHLAAAAWVNFRDCLIDQLLEGL